MKTKPALAQLFFCVILVFFNAPPKTLIQALSVSKLKYDFWMQVQHNMPIKMKSRS